jgi:hypothetical protein
MFIIKIDTSTGSRIQKNNKIDLYLYGQDHQWHDWVHMLTINLAFLSLGEVEKEKRENRNPGHATD